MPEQFNYLSLFSGIPTGGLDLGLDRAGMTCRGQVEKEPFCRRVLEKHWPGVPKHDDVRTAVGWWRSEPRPAVRLVAGGFPCQPVSEAGRRLAQADARWLWPEMAHIIGAIRPEWVIGENVPGLLRRGLADILGDLARLGYRTRTGTISACAMGAPHTRERLFVLAHRTSVRCTQGRVAPMGAEKAHRGRAHATPERVHWWANEPEVARVVYGLPGRVDRIRALGNAVVPQVAEHIGRLILRAQEPPQAEQTPQETT